MNIIDVDYEKLREHINKYIKPIILMNNDTLNLLKAKNQDYVRNNNYNNNVPMIFGCYIAIANWLPLGEVELK